MADLPHRIIFQPRHASICLKMVSQAYRHRSVADLPRHQRMQHNCTQFDCYLQSIELALVVMTDEKRL